MSHPLRTTDREIQDGVEFRFKFRPAPAWISHCKILCGLSTRDYRALRAARLALCPIERQDPIIKAFRYFKMIS